MIYVLLFLVICLVSTIVLEGFPLLLTRERARWIKASIVCNTVTNPLHNSVLVLFSYVVHEEAVLLLVAILLEVVVICAEAVFYAKMLEESFVKCFVLSFSLNVSSFIIGMIFMNGLGSIDFLPGCRVCREHLTPEF